MGSIVDGLVSRETAAEQKAAEEEEHRKAQLRAVLAAVEPRRKSERASAAKTRLKLAQHAQNDPDASGSGAEGSEQSRDSAASGSGSKSGMASESRNSKEEEVEYDPVADLEHNENGHESSEDEGEQESGQDSDSSDVQEVRRKSNKQSGMRKSALRGEAKQTARHAHAENSVMGGEDEDDGGDADLQRALAMSLMEANAAHAAPSTSARDMTGPSYRGTEVPDQQETHAPAPAKPSGRGGRKAKREGAASTGGEQQGKVKGSGKRRKGSTLEARPQDIRKAFGMIAPCGKRISQELLAEVRDHTLSCLCNLSVCFSSRSL